MGLEWHTLPGPSVFLERLHGSLADGKSVLLEAPATLPISLERCLSDRLRDRFQWTPLKAVDGDPLACVRRTLEDPRGLSLSSPEQLYDIQGFGGRILYVADIPPAQIPSWLRFLMDFAHVSRLQDLLDRSAFFVHVSNRPSSHFDEDILLIRRRWEDVIDETDALLVARPFIRAIGASPVLSNLKANLCAGLAQWDLELCDSLCRQNMADLLKPVSLLTQYAKRREWDRMDPAAADDTLWKKGILQSYGGRKCIHTAWHALQGRIEEVSRAIWRAELRVLFPYAEEQLLRIIQLYGRYLKVPHICQDGSPLNDVLDFELAHVRFQFQGSPAVPRQLREYVSKLWLMRNMLAHRDCLDPAYVTPAFLNFDIETLR